MTNHNPPKLYDASTKHKLIPPHARGAVKAGEAAPIYTFSAPDYDRVPVRTYLVETQMATAGLVPKRVCIIVTPNVPTDYPASKRTPGGRLLLTFWAGSERMGSTTFNGKRDIPPRAIKVLTDPKRNTYRHVVMPGEPNYELMQGFENLCEIRRAGANRTVKPDLLLKALGIDVLHKQMFADGRLTPEYIDLIGM